MGPEAISLAVRSNGREGSYRFTCPTCEDDVEKRADRKIVALLVSAGVDISRSDVDAAFAPELFDEEARALKDLKKLPDLERLFRRGFFYAESGPRAYTATGSFLRSKRPERRCERSARQIKRHSVITRRQLGKTQLLFLKFIEAIFS